MIRVTVELISAIDPSRSRVLAMMDIANDGETTARSSALGSYDGRTYRGRSREALGQLVVSPRGRVADWPREALHVWNLVAAMLGAMGYGRRAG